MGRDDDDGEEGRGGRAERGRKDIGGLGLEGLRIWYRGGRGREGVCECVGWGYVMWFWVWV